MTEIEMLTQEDERARGEQIIRDFTTWLVDLPESGDHFHPGLVTHETVQAYLASYGDPQMKAKVLFVLNNFGQWLVENHILSSNPAAGIELPS